ncbi:hypothetical protein M9H77_14506 [Catharanthus roseus]|uniref:Uncharacterized protein n=1 Tax=Catharanthus roseus TaxID=4058 RepID=A0ACC0BNI4_CATRO|nr:hypothetical protein M9H77_14506 [Catharanthus roseus]
MRQEKFKPKIKGNGRWAKWKLQLLGEGSGDFNSILNDNDKSDGPAMTTYQTRDFMECCVDLGLVDMNYTGPHFSWTSRSTWSKIDHVLCNNLWFTSGLNAAAKFFISGCFSDHSPCVVSLFEQMDRPRPRFIFFNMWAEHEDFSRMVEDNWRILIQGTKQFALCRKLKMLKKGLQELNSKHFAHISAKVEAARASLKRAQTDLYERPLDDGLKEEVRQIQNKAVFLIDAERKFFAQKIKCEFFLQGDKGTRFFHSLVKRNAKKNFITSITREDGTYTTNGKEVEDDFISFYGKLLVYGFPMDNIPFRYLGIRLSGVYLKIAYYVPLLEKKLRVPLGLPKHALQHKPMERYSKQLKLMLSWHRRAEAETGETCVEYHISTQVLFHFVASSTGETTNHG